MRMKATATGFSAIRKSLLFGKLYYKLIILQSNVRKKNNYKNTNGDRIISLFVKKSTCTKRLFMDFFSKESLELLLEVRGRMTKL